MHGDPLGVPAVSPQPLQSPHGIAWMPAAPHGPPERSGSHLSGPVPTLLPPRSSEGRWVQRRPPGAELHLVEPRSPTAQLPARGSLRPHLSIGADGRGLSFSILCLLQEEEEEDGC